MREIGKVTESKWQQDNFAPSPKKPASPSHFSALLQTSLAKVNQTKKKDLVLSVEALMEELEELEHDLLKKPNHHNFLRYRSHVRKITSFILKKEFHLRTLRDRKQREYEIVSFTNQNLSKTLQEVLRRNPDIVMILRLMGEVRGLILDLLG